MTSFNRSLLEMINRGEITAEEGMDKASNPQALRMSLQGITTREGVRILG
jgi:Tfp pilus assembly ATPase PilU